MTPGQKREKIVDYMAKKREQEHLARDAQSKIENLQVELEGRKTMASIFQSRIDELLAELEAIDFGVDAMPKRELRTLGSCE